MSLNIEVSSPNSSSSLSQGWGSVGFQSINETVGKLEAVAGRKVATIASRPKEPKQPKGRKVLRRLKGFIVALNGPETRVAFVHEGEKIQYDFPASLLRKKGISALHQPFEMDEVSFEMEPYAAVTAYEFRPLAKVSDGYQETLTLDADRERKRNLIFQKFGNAAG
jgi:hypothetical protein